MARSNPIRSSAIFVVAWIVFVLLAFAPPKAAAGTVIDFYLTGKIYPNSSSGNGNSSFPFPPFGGAPVTLNNGDNRTITGNFDGSFGFDVVSNLGNSTSSANYTLYINYQSLIPTIQLALA